MIRFLKTFGLLTLLSFSITTYCQTSEIRIKFIGNCGLYMTDGVTNIYIDFPYQSGAHHYMKYNSSELDSLKGNPIFIFTHKHSDHYSGKLVTKYAKKLNGTIYTSWRVNKFLKLSTKLKDFNIEAFRTKHRFSIKHYSYMITWHNKRIFIAGDTGQTETITSLKDIDWAFVPAWLLKNANDKGIKSGNIKMFAIYHIGPQDKINVTGDRVLKLDRQGEIIKIPYN